MKILVADTLPDTGLAELRAAGCDVIEDAQLKDEALAEALERTVPEVLIVRSTKVTAQHLQRGPSLALIVRAGAGTNTIDVAEASQRGIYVANCPGKNAIAVAELAFAHMLAIDRHVVDGAVDLRKGVWNKKRYSKARGIAGRTLGLIGLGGIGGEMVPRAHAFGMRVVAWSRSLTPERAAECGIEAVASAREVAARADILSVHVALNDDTRGLIDRTVLEALPRDAIFINTSRGDVVDEDALRWAVRERGLRAGLDVFRGEPSGGSGTLADRDGDGDGDSLFALSGIQGSHHIGASTAQAQHAVAAEAVRIIRCYIETGTVPNCVNLAQRTPATQLLLVRHRDQVGVLAAVLDAIRRADINVEEMQNVIFRGGSAACAKIQLAETPPAATVEQISSLEHVLSVSLKAI